MNVQTSFRRAPATLIGLVAVAVLGACATIEPNQNLADAQARLSTDYNTKLTAERGQGDLANAKSELVSAQTNWSGGEKERSSHQLTMANTYMDLAETRGRQAFLEQDTVRLTNLAQLAAKNRTIASKDRQISDQGQKLTSQDQQISSQGRQLTSQTDQIASQSDQLAGAQQQLLDYHMKITALGSTMVLQDVSFETGKSVLLAGGLNRLQPLITYLRLSPDTRVRIEGYTDNVGGNDYNQRLSLARADAVKSAMITANIDTGRIDTMGSGYDKPVATNATEAGRQENRRVEITLLKQP